MGGFDDHVHIFFGYENLNETVPAIVREIKKGSSKYINSKKWIAGKFEWQPGYSVFSYSHSQIDHVYKYIANQEIHHTKKTFMDEYVEFLESFNVSFKPEYL